MKLISTVGKTSARALLESKHDEILQKWESEVLQSVPAARHKAQAFLYDDLPEFLSALAIALSDDENPADEQSEVEQAVENASEKHAVQRSFSSDYTLKAVLQEYEILHEVIVEMLEREGQCESRSLKVIRKSIHHAIQTTASAFANIRHLDELSKERNFLSAVLDNLAEAVVACDSSGNLSLFNRAAREFHGIPDLPLPADQWSESYSLYRADGVTPLPKDEIPLYRAFRGENVRDVEMVIAPKGSLPRFVVARGRVLKDTAGSIFGAVVAMHDITVAKEAEKTRASLLLEQSQRLAAERLERETTQILERISDSFFALDADWHFVYVNTQVEAMTLKRRDDLLGKTFWVIFPEAVGSNIESEFKRAVTEQCVVTFEADFALRGVWFKVKAYPSSNGLSVYCENVTEIRLAAEALRANAEWLRATLTSIGDGVIATHADAAGTIVFMNPVAEALTGWTLEEAKGRPVLDVFDIINPKSRKPVENPVSRVLAHGTVVGLANHTALRSRSGKDHIIEDSASPVRNDKGELTGVVLVFRDATEEYGLRARANLLARVVESVPAFVSVSSSDGQVYFLNEFARNLTGVASMEDAMRTRILDYFTEEERADVEQEILATVQRKGTWQGEKWVQHHTTGERIPLLFNAFIIADSESDDIHSLACVATDLRERRRLEEEKALAAEQIALERTRLANLFNLAPMAICMLEGPEHVFAFANQSCVNLMLSNRDVFGKTVREALPEFEAQAFRKILDEVYRSAVPFTGREIPISLMQNDGLSKVSYVDFIYQPILTLEGEVEGILVVGNDVTSQVEARTLIAESEERFRNLADSLPQLVWTANRLGEIDYVNRGYLEYTGLFKADIVNWKFGNLVHPDDLLKTTKYWEAALATRDPVQLEIRFRRHDGEYRWFLVRAVPLNNEVGEATKWFGSCTDIHEQMQLSVDLEFAKINAENATKAKSAFLANMSHEIRTPLGVILGFSEFLLEPNQTVSDRQECVATIRRNACQLSQLINDLLDLSKIEADKLEIEKIPFKLDAIIQEVDQTLSLQAREKGIGLKFLSDGPVQDVVTTDPTRLRQILVNIVGNAIKFTERGGVDVRIGMLKPPAGSDSIQLTFVVRDSGIGLTEEQTQRIWAPFVQADSSTTRKFGGTGLGLSLSRRLAQALGGDLVLTRSVLGEGSVFKITIEAGPLAVESTQDKTVTAQTFISKITKPAGGVASLANARVLLVEDSPDNQFLVKRLLTREGAVVDIASDGVEGVNKALAGVYDVVLMDIQMPNLDGYEATAQLRTHGVRIPIIALTAHAMKGDRERAMAHGFDDHLTKPIDRKLIIEKVQSFIRQQPPREARP